jgi:hypothetical protein
MPDQPTTEAAVIHAPWTPEQVRNLNAFQSGGGMHPFTCGKDHGAQAMALIARTDGWHCSAPPCDYRQDWAHAFMADPTAWPKPFPRGVTVLPGPGATPAPTPAPVDPAPATGPTWAALAEIIATLPPATAPYPDRDLRQRVAAALLTRIKQAVVPAPDRLWPGQIGSLLAATEYDLADVALAVLAPELERAAHAGRLEIALRANQTAALEATERAEAAEAALARIRDLAATTHDNTTPGRSDYDIGRHNLAGQILATLDTPDPAEEPTP